MSNEAEDLVAELRALIAQGRKIEAVKRYREATGVDLAEALRVVETIEQVQPSPEGGSPEEGPPDWELDAELIELLKGGKKLQAIKLYRERTGADLKGSKDAVEALAARQGITVPSGSGCLGALLLMALLSAAIFA